MSRWLKTFMRASGPETFVGEWAGGPDERSEEANGPEAFVGEWAGGLCGRVGRRPLRASGPETFVGEWAEGPDERSEEGLPDRDSNPSFRVQSAASYH